MVKGGGNAGLREPVGGLEKVEGETRAQMETGEGQRCKCAGGDREKIVWEETQNITRGIERRQHGVKGDLMKTEEGRGGEGGL